VSFALPLVFAVLVAPTGAELGATSECVADDFAAARQRLGPSGRVDVETSTAGVKLTAFRGESVVWSATVRSQDCATLGQIADIGVERALRRPSTSASVGDVPSLVTTTPAEPEWQLELGAGAQAELAVLRGGGAVDVFLRRGGLGGRLEIGAFGPRGGSVEDAGVEIGTLDFFTVYGLLSVEGCLLSAGLPSWLRPCVGLGGGLDWVDARVSGDRLFRTEGQSRVSGRLDGTLRLGWAPRPAGLEVWLRLTGRPSPPSFRVEGATVDEGLPELTAAVGLRGWLEIF
jgi:hypothetical protein